MEIIKIEGESKICFVTLMLKLLYGCLERLGNPNLNVKIDRTDVYLFLKKKTKQKPPSISIAVYCTFLLFVDTVFRMPDFFLIST